MKKYLLAASLGAVMSACSEKKDTFQKPAAAPPTVDVIVASGNVLSKDLEVNGTVVANEFLQLMPEVSGRLVYLNIPEGKQVAKGTVIARINDADLQAQLKKVKVQLELVELTEQRLKKLLDVNGVNQSEYDQVLNQVNSLKADIDILEAQIAKTVVVAPFTGHVGLRQISNGAFVTTGTVITTMQETNPLKLDFNVPEEFLTYLKKGDYVTVKIEGQQELLRAPIIALEPQVDQTSRSLTVRALLGRSNANPGAFAKVYLKLGGERKAIQVPTNSIIPEAKSKKVVVVRNGKAEYVDVETGTRDAQLVEITNGLAEGDTVVVSGVLFARKGRPVTIGKVTTLAQSVVLTTGE